MKPTVLVIDDVTPLAEQYAYDLERLGGFRTEVAGGGVAGLAALSSASVDCVILDLEMPDMDGFDVLRAMDHHQIDVPVIVYTGTGNYARCVEAVRLGAFSFIDKAEPMERVVQEVRLALGHRSLAARVEDLEQQLEDASPLLGESAAMAELRNRIDTLAAIPSPVLVLGESGTGKELVARELHLRGPRRRGAFVPLNCGGLAEGLVESDLFGHEKGAFTGAAQARRGAFERASGGTLFLDEVGELPASAQARLLRVLETGEVSRLGSEALTAVDPRVVAATHRDLDRAVEERSFRQDLLYRLNVHVIRVPPLRERRTDVPALVRHFLQTLAPKLGVPVPAVTTEALEALEGRDWRRNNVRELRNTVERMIIAGGPVLDLQQLPPDLEAPTVTGGGDGVSGSGGRGTFQERKRAAERRIVEDALKSHGWQITETASALGLADHASLLKIMRRLGIKRP
ncbi:MAG: sigma-54 dependent transcriptional regulator [Gemmatimonadota bacterium]|nr:sigma-54 dependent transcriptional regulator [Gemmatimonadota bacterium]